MLGPRGSTGIYLVGLVCGELADPSDYRRAKSKRQTVSGLGQSLGGAADSLRAGGIDVRYRVIDLTLEHGDLPETNGEGVVDDSSEGDEQHDDEPDEKRDAVARE